MPELFRYSQSFQPLLLEDMTATLFGADLPTEGLNVKCVAVGALPEYQKDFGALTAATWSNDNNDTNLEFSPNELAQLRIRVQDDIKVRLKNPSAVQQWRSKDTNFHLPQFPTDQEDVFLKEFLFAASEFFVWEDNTPRFDLYSQIATTKSVLLFSGWRFKIVKISQPGRIKVYVSSWPTVQ